MSRRKDEAYVSDMLNAAHQTREYLQGISEAKWHKDRKTQDAVLRQLTIIGEAADSVTANLRNTNSLIDWRDIADFRHLAVHQYWDINLEYVWDIVKKDLPELVRKLKTVKL